MRDAFSDALVDLAKADPNVLLLTGDHGYALFDSFRQHCPGQYINAGIAEQNMVGMAAGLARAGFRPFVYGLAAFVPIRVLEQIKLDIAHDDLPVVLLGDGAGFVYSSLGTSHQSTEDIACARSVPGLAVLSPADRFEMTACMHYAYRSGSPVYLRMGKSDRGDVHEGALVDFDASRMLKLRQGRSDRPGILATGSMVITALDVASMHDLSVWSVPGLKPVCSDDIVEASKTTKGIITIEEHSIYGGLGGLVAEILSEQFPVRLLRIGVADRFSEQCGGYQYLLREHGLDHETVKVKVSRFIQSMQ